MRFLLGFERSPWWGVLGAAAAVAFCLARVRRLTASKSSALTRLEVFQLVGIWALLLGAAWSLVLTPWIWFRTRHLPWTALTR